MQNHQSTTSLNSMQFNQDFEAQVNSNMNPGSSSASHDQKGPFPVASPDPMQSTDGEFNEKMAMKDQGQHHLPPRFSTIFDTKGPAAPAPPRAFESYPEQPTRKSGGILIAKPLFWALFAIFLFESAVLFAYTVIGLVNNMPARLVHTNSAGAVVAGYDCNSQPINISPNFYMPQGPQAPVVDTTTATTLSTSSSTTSTSTSTSTSVDASRIAELMKSIAEMKTSESSTHTPTTRITTVTPPGETIKSTTILTVDASGNTKAPPSTVTSTTIVAPSPTLNTRDEITSLVSTNFLTVESGITMEVAPPGTATTMTISGSTLVFVDPSGNTVTPTTSVVSTSKFSGPGITISPIVVTTAADGRLVSVSIEPKSTSTIGVANDAKQDDEPVPSGTSTVATMTSSSGSTSTRAPLIVVPLSTRDDVGIIVSVSMAPASSPTSDVPSMSLALKTHAELANKATQDAEPVPSSTSTVSVFTYSPLTTSASVVPKIVPITTDARGIVVGVSMAPVTTSSSRRFTALTLFAESSPTSADKPTQSASLSPSSISIPDVSKPSESVSSPSTTPSTSTSSTVSSSSSTSSSSTSSSSTSATSTTESSTSAPSIPEPSKSAPSAATPSKPKPESDLDKAKGVCKKVSKFAPKGLDIVGSLLC